MYNRSIVLNEAAELYHKFLTNIDWENETYVATLNECRTTYLSYSILTLLKSRSGINKYKLTTDYVSKDALEKIRNKEVSGLRFEHMIPKKKYVQQPLEKMAKNGTLTVKDVLDKLRKYWYIAAITSEEDKKLLRSDMPSGWDEEDHLARYKEAIDGDVRLSDNLIKNTLDLYID